MQTINKYQAALRMVVICLLLASFISTSLHVVPEQALKGSAFLKKGSKHKNHDAEFPLEGNEKELESRSENKTEEVEFLVHFFDLHQASLFSESLRLTLPPTTHLTGRLSDIPLYLLKRSLLI